LMATAIEPKMGSTTLAVCRPRTAQSTRPRASEREKKRRAGRESESERGTTYGDVGRELGEEGERRAEHQQQHGDGQRLEDLELLAQELGQARSNEALGQREAAAHQHNDAPMRRTQAHHRETEPCTAARALGGTREG
jgi:hypothetical protein